MSEFEIQERQDSAPATRGVQTEMMVSRQAQEVQAAIVIAKRFPRDQVESYNRVINACKRRKLAENAIYEYPRGGERITGPSIRLAEALAQNWGNIDFGITELEQRKGESQVMAYAWDLETNARQTKIFTVKHIRHTKRGDYELTDPRDIYELVANNGARRLRACILGVIPGDVIDAAVDQCNKTLASANGDTPLVDVIRAMAAHFKDEFGVTLQMLEKYVGWKSESFSMQDVIKLKKVYNSLKDGMVKKEEVFDMTVSEPVVDALGTDDTKKGKEEKAEPKQAASKQAKKQSKPATPPPVDDSFMIPDDFNDAELPFK